MKYLIFDVDGTLIDTKQMYMPAMIEALAEFGYHYDEATSARYQRELFGITGYDSLLRIGIDEAQIPAILKRWNELTIPRQHLVTAFDQIPATISKLATQDEVKLAIATSKTTPEITDFKGQFTWAGLFNVIVGADDTKEHKPNPEPLLMALHRLDPNANVADAYYIGDTNHDLKAAHNAGMHFAGAIYGSAMPEKLAAAEVKLTTPADLLQL